MTSSPRPCVSCRNGGRRATLQRGRRRLRYLILQHADWEAPGLYGDLLHEYGLLAHTVRPDRGEKLPDWRDFDAILAMGGPMSVNDRDRLPWLDREIDVVAAAVAAGRPFFGACLGGQILAAAAGARVFPGPRPEIGVYPVDMAPESFTDPVFGGLPRQVEVMQWHGETFDLPAGAVSLAGSDGIAHQALRVGRHAYGVQFHLEITGPLLARWLEVPGCRREAEQLWGTGAGQVLTGQLRAAEPRMRRLARRIFTDWLVLVAHARCPARLLTAGPSARGAA